MKKHRSIPLVLATCIFLFLPGCSRSRPKVAPPAPAEFEWLTDYKTAQEQAKATHKFVLLNFTGSDWCGWCIKFDKEVLSQPRFKDYARNHLVLVELDFPRRKSLTPELREQNVNLAQQYDVYGFPTIVVLNSDGQKLWKFDGYFPGGPEAFVAELEKLTHS